MINVKITNFSGSLEVCGLTDIETCCLQLLSGEKTCIIADYRTLTRSPKPTKQVGGEGRLRKQSPVRVAGPGAPAGSGSPRRRCPVRRRARVSLSPDTSSCPVVVTAVATAAPAAGQSGRSPPVPESARGGPAMRGAAIAPRPGPPVPAARGSPAGPSRSLTPLRSSHPRRRQQLPAAPATTPSLLPPPSSGSGAGPAPALPAASSRRRRRQFLKANPAASLPAWWDGGQGSPGRADKELVSV